MIVTGVHHVGIPVYDLERASAFYREVLGIPLSTTPSYNPASIAFSSLKRIAPSSPLSAITKRTRPWLCVSA